MTVPPTRRSLLAACIAGGVLLTTTAAIDVPAQAAATSCAPDRFENDDPGTGTVAPLPVSRTVYRAICQSRGAQDFDWFYFTAVEGKSYTASVKDLGAGLVNDDSDRGGLQLSFAKLGADSHFEDVPQSIAPNGDRSTTTALHAGRYLVLAVDTDTQVYPDNTRDTKTIQGDDGKYGVALAATAPAPVMKSLTASRTEVKQGDRSTVKLTFSAPLLSGGAFTPVFSSNSSAAAPGGVQVAPGGASTWTVPIDARFVGKDTPVTISAQVAGVGPVASVKIIVKK